MRRFKGFTLSELMVALAVIGILVAVVTPAIMRTRPNKNKMMVKKSFAAVEQIVSSLINDEKLYPDMSEFCEEGATSDEDTEYCAYGFDYTEETNAEGFTYSGDYKFAALFKEKLNVKNDDPNECTDDAKGNVGPQGENFCSIFYTTDGIKWDLTGTKDAWQHSNVIRSVGTFDTECKENPDNAGCGTILIDANGVEGPNLACTAANEDCDQYEVQILSNGKLRINPAHTRAVDWVTINTSIKDSI